MLFPDEKTRTLSQKHSSGLNQKFPCFFQLDEKHIPHITLVHGELKDTDLEKISQKLSMISKDFHEISVLPVDVRRGVDVKTFIGVYFNPSQFVQQERTVLASLFCLLAV